MLINETQAIRLSKAIDNSHLTPKQIKNELLISEKEIQYLIKGNYELNGLSFKRLCELLKVDMYDIIYGDVHEYIPTYDIDEEGIKYFTRFEQIVKNNDMKYIEERFNSENLPYMSDENGNFLIKVCLKYYNLEMIKYIIERAAEEQKEAKNDFIKLLQLRAGNQFSNLFNDLRRLAIIKNDIKFLNEVAKYYNPTYKDLNFVYTKEGTLYDGISHPDVTLETLEYLTTSRFFNLEELMCYTSSINNKQLLIKLIKVYHKKQNYKTNLDYCFILPKYQNQYENDLKSYSVNVKNYDSNIDPIYEKYVLFRDFKVLDALAATNYTNPILKWSLKLGQLDVITNYDDGLLWERKATFKNLDFIGIPDDHINKFLPVPNGKFEYALHSRDNETINYMLSKSKSNLKPEEALVFSDISLFRPTFMTIPEVGYIQRIREMNMADFSEFLRNHMNKKRIDLKQVKSTNKDLEYVEKYISTHIIEGHDAQFAEEKDKAVIMLQDAAISAFSSSIVTVSIFKDIFNNPELEIGKIGLNFAVLTKKYELAKFLMPFSTVNQLRLALNMQLDDKLTSDFRSYIEVFSKKPSEYEKLNNPFSTIDELTKAKYKSEQFTSQAMAILEDYLPDLTVGNREVLLELLNNLYDKVHKKYKDSEILELFVASFEYTNTATEAVKYLESVCHGEKELGEKPKFAKVIKG